MGETSGSSKPVSRSQPGNSRLIAVIIFGILTHAFIQVSSESKCNHEAMKNFDSEKYFKIAHTYVTHAKNGRNSNFCRELTTTKHDNGTVVTIAEGHDETDGTTYYSKIYCSGNPTNDELGEFSLDCNFLEDTRKRLLGNYRLYTSVIDTDYKKYAILYRCTMIGPTPLENILVLKTNLSAGDEEIKESLKNNGMDLDKFISRDKTYCDNIKKKGVKGEEKKET